MARHGVPSTAQLPMMDERQAGSGRPGAEGWDARARLGKARAGRGYGHCAVFPIGSRSLLRKGGVYVRQTCSEVYVRLRHYVRLIAWLCWEVYYSV